MGHRTRLVLAIGMLSLIAQDVPPSANHWALAHRDILSLKMQKPFAIPHRFLRRSRGSSRWACSHPMSSFPATHCWYNQLISIRPFDFLQTSLSSPMDQSTWASMGGRL